MVAIETGWSHLLCVLGKIKVLHRDITAILGTVTIVAPKPVQRFLRTRMHSEVRGQKSEPLS